MSSGGLSRGCHRQGWLAAKPFCESLARRPGEPVRSNDNDCSQPSKERSMKRNLVAAPLALALALCGSAAALGAGDEGGFRDPRLQQDERRLRQPELGRLGHPEQPDDAVGRGVQEGISERPHPDRGQGLLDGAAGADPGHLAARTDEPHHAGGGDRRLREEVRLQADRRSASRSTASASSSTRTTRSSA